MIKGFISFYRPHKWLFILDMVCAFLIAAVDLIFPQVTRLFINELIPNRMISMLAILSGVVLVVFILRYFLDYVVTYYGHVLGVRIEYDMRKSLFAHIQRFSFKFFDETKTGQLMSRLVNDLNEITELAHHGPEDIFISIVMLVGSFILLLMINVPLTLLVFLLVPPMIFFTIRINMKMRKNFRSIRKTIGEVNSQIEESLLGVRVVQAFNNEAYEEEKFDQGNKKFKDLRSEGFKIMGVFSGGINLFSGLLTLVSLAAGGYMVYLGAINTGDLVAYLLYMGMMVGPAKKIAMFAELYQKGMAGYSRFVEIMDLKPDILDEEDAKSMDEMIGKVEFKNVSFAYEDEGEFVLDHLNLTVEAGSTVALVGASGVGKTTLSHLIPRFYDVDKGEILIDDVPIKKITLDSLRSHIGVVPQDVFLFSGTIGENIRYGDLNASDGDVRNAAKMAFIDEFIESLEDGYDTYIGERGIKLSGGQKQRLAIARMFLKNPSILIFDEATSALDNRSEKYVQASMTELSKGKTTFIIAHRLSTIKNAERIIVLTDQGVIESGSHEDLLVLNGEYAKLYQAGFE